jgi:tetratricopeptide (TPR) repeat protein
VVRDFALAAEALSNGRVDEAQKGFSKAVEQDKNFGPGYFGLAAVSMGLGRQQDAEKYTDEAVRHLDRMSERERFAARAFFYLVRGDYQACTKEYADLLARYAQDSVAHNNLALCSLQLRDVPKAVAHMRDVVTILPKRSLYRGNLSLYAAYGSDFQTAEQEGKVALEMKNRAGWLRLAFAHLGLGQLPQAGEAYQQLAKVDALGLSQSASGLGDLAAFEGRFADAVKILEAGAAADVQAKEAERAADKFLALANVQLARKQQRPAAAAAERALMLHPKAVKIRFMAARVFIEANQIPKAQALIAELAKERLAEPRAYAKILEGQMLLKKGELGPAIDSFTAANGLLDTWIGRFDLGRAYLQADEFALADSEFDRCLKRRGEALALFLDQDPNYSFLPPVYYYQGRAREGLKTAGYGDSYRAYLNIRGKSSEDSLVPDARRRAGS